MLRPFIYMAAFRLMLGGIFLLAWQQFIRNAPGANMIAGFLAALYLLFAFLIYLRMDGLAIPRIKNYRSKMKRKDPTENLGNMADHLDDDTNITYDDLEDDEKDACSFLSNLVCAAVFLVLSFVL